MHSHAFAGERTVYAYSRQVIKCRGMHRLYRRIISFLSRARSRGESIYARARAKLDVTGTGGSNFSKIWVIRFAQRNADEYSRTRERASLRAILISSGRSVWDTYGSYNWDAGPARSLIRILFLSLPLFSFYSRRPFGLPPAAIRTEKLIFGTSDFPSPPPPLSLFFFYFCIQREGKISLEKQLREKYHFCRPPVWVL